MNRTKIEKRAQAQLLAAERRGEVTRPFKCQRCGTRPEHRMGIQAHHHIDYALPLEVLWLCIPCHEAEHRKLRAEGRTVPYSPDTRSSECAESTVA